MNDGTRHIIDHRMTIDVIMDMAGHHLFHLPDLRWHTAAEPEPCAGPTDQRESDSYDKINHLRHLRIVYDGRETIPRIIRTEIRPYGFRRIHRHHQYRLRQKDPKHHKIITKIGNERKLACYLS